MALTLQELNTASPAQALAWLDGVYEHSPWIASQALAERPFRSLAHLKHAMASAVRNAAPEAQLALIRAHPELAGKAMVVSIDKATALRMHPRAGHGRADRLLARRICAHPATQC